MTYELHFKMIRQAALRRIDWRRGTRREGGSWFFKEGGTRAFLLRQLPGYAAGKNTQYSLRRPAVGTDWLSSTQEPLPVSQEDCATFFNYSVSQFPHYVTINILSFQAVIINQTTCVRNLVCSDGWLTMSSLTVRVTFGDLQVREKASKRGYIERSNFKSCSTS